MHCVAGSPTDPAPMAQSQDLAEAGSQQQDSYSLEGSERHAVSRQLGDALTAVYGNLIHSDFYVSDLFVMNFCCGGIRPPPPPPLATSLLGNIG